MGTFKVIWMKMLNLAEKVDDTHEVGENFSGIIPIIFSKKKEDQICINESDTE